MTQFDNAAGKRFVEFLEELEAKIREEEVPAIEAHLAKYRSLVPSLALLIHLAESDGGPVRQPALIRAAGWAQYLESHARRVFASLAHKEVASANRLLRKLKKGVFTGTLTVRDIYHERGWGGLTDRDTVQEAVDLLVDFGYLRALPARGPGRPTVRYCLHPRLRSEVRD